MVKYLYAVALASSVTVLIINQRNSFTCTQMGEAYYNTAVWRYRGVKKDTTRNQIETSMRNQGATDDQIIVAMKIVDDVYDLPVRGPDGWKQYAIAECQGLRRSPE